MCRYFRAAANNLGFTPATTSFAYSARVVKKLIRIEISTSYLAHYHAERNHQGKDNVLLFPVATKVPNCVEGSVSCKERLGGLLKYYHREAA
jgi:hypothetical protein